MHHSRGSEQNMLCKCKTKKKRYNEIKKEENDSWNQSQLHPKARSWRLTVNCIIHGCTLSVIGSSTCYFWCRLYCWPLYSATFLWAVYWSPSKNTTRSRASGAANGSGSRTFRGSCPRRISCGIWSTPWNWASMACCGASPFRFCWPSCSTALKAIRSSRRYSLSCICPTLFPWSCCAVLCAFCCLSQVL